MATILIDWVSDQPHVRLVRMNEVEEFRSEIGPLLRLIAERIPDSRMSPCVRWSLGTLALVSGHMSEVPPSAIQRALQMAEATELPLA